MRLHPVAAFTTLTIPLLGTPHFDDRVKSRHFLPLTKLRDMDGFTLLTKPLDDIDRVLPFVKSLVELDGRFSEFARRGFRFLRRYWRSLSAQQIAFTVVNSFPRLIHKRRTVAATDDDNLTYISTTQPLGPLYSPMFTVPERHRVPHATMITDGFGGFSLEIAENLSGVDASGARNSGTPAHISALARFVQRKSTKPYKLKAPNGAPFCTAHQSFRFFFTFRLRRLLKRTLTLLLRFPGR